jgi:hypothetical protein
MEDKVAGHAHAEDVYTTPQRKGGVINKLYPPGPTPGAKGRMKNHCRKFWWCGKCALVASTFSYLHYLRLPGPRDHCFGRYSANHIRRFAKQGTA